MPSCGERVRVRRENDTSTVRSSVASRPIVLTDESSGVRICPGGETKHAKRKSRPLQNYSNMICAMPAAGLSNRTKKKKKEQATNQTSTPAPLPYKSQETNHDRVDTRSPRVLYRPLGGRIEARGDEANGRVASAHRHNGCRRTVPHERSSNPRSACRHDTSQSATGLVENFIHSSNTIYVAPPMSVEGTRAH